MDALPASCTGPWAGKKRRPQDEDKAVQVGHSSSESRSRFGLCAASGRTLIPRMASANSSLPLPETSIASTPPSFWSRESASLKQGIKTGLAGTITYAIYTDGTCPRALGGLCRAGRDPSQSRSIVESGALPHDWINLRRDRSGTADPRSGRRTSGSVRVLCCFSWPVCFGYLAALRCRLLPPPDSPQH